MQWLDEITKGMAQNAHSPQWLAELELEFAPRSKATVLSRCRHQGPLSVQRAFYPEQDGCAHVYLLHPPAGIVSGDELRIQARLEPGSRALLTTPGANRFYRARSTADNNSAHEHAANLQQIQRCWFEVEAGAALEYLPLETLVYQQANAVNQVDIRVQGDGCYLGWEVLCLGLPHIQQPFTQGRLLQSTTLFHNEKPLFHDRMQLQGSDSLQQQKIALGKQHVVGSFIIFSGKLCDQPAALASLISSLRECLATHQQQNNMAVTELQGVVVVRHLGDSSEYCRDVFSQLWCISRQHVLGKKDSSPRIWYT